MPNPLFNAFNGSRTQNPIPNGNNKMANMMNFMNQFKQFRNNFKGSPQQQVQNLLASGQMSQEQYEQLSNMAAEFKDMLR